MGRIIEQINEVEWQSLRGLIRKMTALRLEVEATAEPFLHSERSVESLTKALHVFGHELRKFDRRNTHGILEALNEYDMLRQTLCEACE